MERKPFLDRIKNSTGLEKIDALLIYSRYLCKIDPAESILQAKEAYGMARDTGDNRFIMSTYSHLAYANYYGGNYLNAEQWANRLLKVSKIENLILAIGTAYNVKGSIANKLNNHTEAIGCYLAAIEQYTKANNSTELMSCYNNIGMIHSQEMQFAEAKTYFNLALNIAEELDKPAQYTIRMNLANLLFELEKYEEALEIYQDTAKYYRENDLRINEASALYNIATAYSMLKKIDESLEYFQKSYSLYKQFQDPYYITEACASMSEILIKKGRFDEAQNYLEEAEELARKIDLKFNLRNIYKAYAELCKARGELEEAISYLYKYIKLNEEYIQENHNKEVAELEARHKTQIFMRKSSELGQKNKVMQDQIDTLSSSLEELQAIHTNLQEEFSEAVIHINDQDNILSSQARMAVMGEMISSIAHQWKQPLNVIAVLSQSIDDAWDFDELDDSFLKKQTSMILSQVNYMSDIISDFRNFFKTDYISSFSVKETIDKSINLVNYLLKKQNAKISIIYDKECYLSGNPNEITQAIVNIINNGMEAMQRNVVAEPKIVIKLNCDEEFVTIRVHNTGEPIKDELLEKIFEPYFTTRGKEGTGLGLHICRFIIENKYHGSVNVENINEGVEFILKIPSKV